MSYFYILDINSLSVTSFTNIFSHPQGSHFVLWIVSFDVQKLLIGPNFAFLSFILGVQFSSAAQLCPTLCDPHLFVACCESQHARPPCPSANSQSLSTPMSIESVMPSSHLIHSSPSPPSPKPSQHQGLFQWVNSSHDVAKVSEFQRQHQSFQWTPRTDLLQDGLDLDGLDGWTSLQSKGLSRVFSNTTIFQHSAFFIVQLSHAYMTIGKTIALNRQTFVGKVMSLIFNMLSRLVITFLPRSKCLLIWGTDIKKNCYNLCLRTFCLCSL